MRVLLVLTVLAACPAPESVRPNTPRVTVTPPPDAPPAPPPPPIVEEPVPALRLPNRLAVAGYDVRLALDPARPTFAGAVTITGDITEKTSVLWLHGRHLKVSRAAASHGDPFETSGHNARKLVATPRGEDLLELRADAPLEPGRWQIEIEYEGEIDHVNTSGLFSEASAGRTYLFTQLEAIYARRVFPCIDEPDTKVPWKLTLDVPQDLAAVANTPVEKETALGNGIKRVEFAPTKPLPSYLVAFAVGAFDFVDAGKTHNGTPVRIVALKGRAAEAAWAAKTSPRVVDLLEDWFGTPYPYEKLDLVSIPLTVGFGAMENAGLVTFTESAILIDPQHPSQRRRHSWVNIAAHELSHQWFGDLVTMKFWDDIWLNEGFANWMEGKITARFDPAWHDELGELQMRDAALGADSVISARQIRQPIKSTADILEVFDGITYDKGASVLNMFETYLGADVFQQGVRAYLKARAFGNATSTDFVTALGAAANKDVASAFATFLDQPGEPDLTATVACDKGAPRVEITQQRYVPPGSPTPEAGKPWLLPVCVAYERGGKRAEACGLLEQAAGSIPLETKSCPRWIMPNVNGRGYYRVQLALPQVIALRDEAWPLLTWTERRALFEDVTTSVHRAKKAKLPLTVALSFVPKMMSGGDRFTVGDAVGLPEGLERMVADDQRAKYEAWLRMMFAAGATQVGVMPKDTDDLDIESTRRRLYSVAAWLGHEPQLVEQSVELARAWRDLPQAMRGTILAVAVDANTELFDKILRDVKTEQDRVRRGEMLGALASVRDPGRMQTALALTLDTQLDFRETMEMLYAGSTDATRKVGEQFFRDHQDELMKRMPTDEVSGSSAGLSWIFTRECDPARRDEIAEYVTKTFGTLAGGERTVKQAIEGMDQCIASRKVIEPEVRAWLGGVKIQKPKDQKAKPKP